MPKPVKLMVAFGFALAGGALMLVVPYLALSAVLKGRILQFSGPACLNLFVSMFLNGLEHRLS